MSSKYHAVKTGKQNIFSFQKKKEKRREERKKKQTTYVLFKIHNQLVSYEIFGYTDFCSLSRLAEIFSKQLQICIQATNGATESSSTCRHNQDLKKNLT